MVVRWADYELLTNIYRVGLKIRELPEDLTSGCADAYGYDISRGKKCVVVK